MRTETSISSGAVSVSSAAAELAQLKLPSHSFADANVCIIGAGKMSRLLVKHLASKGCSRVTLLNRSLARAELLAGGRLTTALWQLRVVQSDYCASLAVSCASSRGPGRLHAHSACASTCSLAPGTYSSHPIVSPACCMCPFPALCSLAAKHCQPPDMPPNLCPAAEFPDVTFDVHLMPELMQCVAASDCIFAASGSEHILISAADLANMEPASEAVGGMRRFFDISVPRNVHSNINSQLEGRARVFNVDDLKEVVEANKEARKQAAAEAELLLREEQLSFECWRDGLATVPTIKALRSKAESVRALELEKALNKLGDGLTKKQLRAVEDLSRGIVNKLLHGPMTALRCDSSDTAALSETLANMEALERMFELSQIELSQLVQR